ncbi:MAG TPA: FxsA family protein [Acidimicrobiales bacterium]|nr:FxsA family protein [Acidimicrobiales bacterium]
MVGVLVVLFLVVPLAELYVIIQVGQAFGALNTIALLVIVSAVGAWLVKREGMSVWRRFQRQVESGSVPGKEIADGVMILFAGALLMTPGFLTDLLGISLLLPPVRAVVRGAVMRRAARRAGIFRIDGGRIDGGRTGGFGG